MTTSHTILNYNPIIKPEMSYKIRKRGRDHIIDKDNVLPLNITGRIDSECILPLRRGSCLFGIKIFRHSSCGRAKAMPITFRAPAFFKQAAQLLTVAPVVMTSSTSTITFP